MIRKSVILHFEPVITDKPIISQMVRDNDVSVNILQARITPEENGTMFVWIEGEADNVQGALDYLEGVGTRLLFPTEQLIWDESRCTHCGACIGQCLSKALSLDPDTAKVSFDQDRCLACELCIPACPFGALDSVVDHLRDAGKKP